MSLGVSSAQGVPEVDVLVDPAARRQTIVGWGATLSFLHNLNYASQDVVHEIVSDAVNDLGLTFLRIRDGVLDEPVNDNVDPGAIDWSGFQDGEAVDREVARGLSRFLALVRDRGETPALLLSKDAFPRHDWMSEAEFAEHLLANLLYYKTQHGIDLTYAAVQNEPPSGSAADERHRGIIRLLGPRLTAAGLATRLALNEGADTRSAHSQISAVLDEAGVRPHVGLLSWHVSNVNDPFRALLRDIGGSRAIPTGMTSATGAGFEELLADLTDGNVSIWAPKVLADSGRADAGTGFFTVNPDGTSYRRHPDYFFFRQFMRYIRPGAVRLETTSNSPDVRAFGFEQANGRVLVLVNRASTPVNVWIRGLLPATWR